MMLKRYQKLITVIILVAILFSILFPFLMPFLPIEHNHAFVHGIHIGAEHFLDCPGCLLILTSLSVFVKSSIILVLSAIAYFFISKDANILSFCKNKSIKFVSLISLKVKLLN